MSVNIGSLLGAAKQSGSISAASANVLTAVDIGDLIREGMGVSVDDIQASDAILATFLIDDSGSIRMAGNSQAVRDGYNGCLLALKDAKQEKNLLVQTAYLNGGILNPYAIRASAVQMDSQNYNPTGGTPLYEATIVTLGRVLAKSQEFADSGCPRAHSDPDRHGRRRYRLPPHGGGVQDGYQGHVQEGDPHHRWNGYR